MVWVSGTVRCMGNTCTAVVAAVGARVRAEVVVESAVGCILADSARLLAALGREMHKGDPHPVVVGYVGI